MPFLPLPGEWGGAAVEKTLNTGSRKRKYWFARRNSGIPLTRVQDEKQRNHETCRSESLSRRFKGKEAEHLTRKISSLNRSQGSLDQHLNWRISYPITEICYFIVYHSLPFSFESFPPPSLCKTWKIGGWEFMDSISFYIYVVSFGYLHYWNSHHMMRLCIFHISCVGTRRRHADDRNRLVKTRGNILSFYVTLQPLLFIHTYHRGCVLLCISCWIFFKLEIRF